MANPACLRNYGAVAFSIVIALALSIAPAEAEGQPSSYYPGEPPFCISHPGFCADAVPPTWDGKYVGHDEPSLIFYSSTPGAGNNSIYMVTLPKDPPTLPKQNGKGGTFNFQLHPAFWFGMAMCDTQSFPEYNNSTCQADSDTNIFDDGNSASASYIGHHPGTAFMEMQFYPPGWVSWAKGGNSCDGKHWCAALNIDSLNEDPLTGAYNNTDCYNRVGYEPVNFAFITKSGIADSPGDPLNNGHFTPNLKTDLLMNPGDKLIVDLHDSTDGFQVVIYDLTSHKTGSMTASIANGFKQVMFEPSSGTCHSQSYAFHPMYSTASPHTRVPWAAHSYNIAFADEIGHWEYCASADPTTGLCLSGGDSDNDDQVCFNGLDSTRIKVGGCIGTEFDFDGACYQNNWPGSNPVAVDKKLHPKAILFSSPLLAPSVGGPFQNYSSTASEADLPIIEYNAGFSCDTSSGSGCINPPPNATFYPFFSTMTVANICEWALGGSMLSGAGLPFGSDSNAAFGSIYPLTYADASGSYVQYNNFQKALGSNPCQAPVANLKVPSKPIGFGTRAKGSPSPAKTFAIVNQSPYPIAVASITPTNSDYTLIKNGCSPLIAPLASCDLKVKFTPSVTGADPGGLTLNDDASNGPQTITFTGSGR